MLRIIQSLLEIGAKCPTDLSSPRGTSSGKFSFVTRNRKNMTELRVNWILERVFI